MAIILISLVSFWIIYLNWDKFMDKLNCIFFSEAAAKEEIRICPECGSGNWKFPNPLKPANKMINTYHLVNNLFECVDCGHIGIFFLIDEETKKGLKTKKKITEENKSKSGLEHLSSFLISIVSIPLFIFSASILWCVIVVMAVSGFLKKIFGKDKKKL